MTAMICWATKTPKTLSATRYETCSDDDIIPARAKTNSPQTADTQNENNYYMLLCACATIGRPLRAVIWLSSSSSVSARV